MSRTQNALFRKESHCANPTVPVEETCEIDTRDRSDKSYQVSTLRDFDLRQVRPRPILRIVPDPSRSRDRSPAESGAQLRTTRVERTGARNTKHRSKGRKAPAHADASVSVQQRPKEDESIAAQIGRFQERGDLRECQLPGMRGRISRKACEGWQKQASLRNSRMLAKIKLAPCKECRYTLKRAAPGV